VKVWVVRRHAEDEVENAPKATGMEADANDQAGT